MATLLIARALGPGYIPALRGILWTVYAELAYYALYPLLLPFIFRFGIERVLALSLTISFSLIVTHPHEIYLFAFGPKLTWLFNAPLWLMGCYLAERRTQITDLASRFPINILRLGVIAYCYVSTLLANHMGAYALGYTWTIWFFGAYCMLWLAAEMKKGTGKKTFVMLERFGLAGYSLYLMHMIAIHFVQTNLKDLTPLGYWLTTSIIIFALTWIFYRSVEWPAHKLARSLGRARSAKS
jgi:peptidoglycan/LPS O-acetylase OafA/YrhL